VADLVEKIRREIFAWPGVEAKAHRFGGVELRVLGHEIGHLHGEKLADLPLSIQLRKEPVAEGKARLHHALPKTWWVSHPIRGETDVSGALGLFRPNYERIVAREKGEARA
jgi:hypothetical protein